MNKTEQELEQEIQSLTTQLRNLREGQRKEKALAFIAANNITLDDVEMSKGEGMPWFGYIGTFAAYLKKLPTVKRFTEWNTILHYTSDVMNGDFLSLEVYLSDIPTKNDTEQAAS